MPPPMNTGRGGFGDGGRGGYGGRSSGFSGGRGGPGECAHAVVSFVHILNLSTLI